MGVTRTTNSGVYLEPEQRVAECRGKKKYVHAFVYVFTNINTCIRMRSCRRDGTPTVATADIRILLLREILNWVDICISLVMVILTWGSKLRRRYVGRKKMVQKP